MADLARLHFLSERFPEGEGELALGEDGRFRVEVGEAMLERIAAREAEIVERSARISRIAAAGLMALGIVSLAAGWLAGRLGGRLRERWTDARPVDKAEFEYDLRQGLRVTLNESRLRPATLVWKPGEYDPAEAQRFCEAALELQRRRSAEERK